MIYGNVDTPDGPGRVLSARTEYVWSQAEMRSNPVAVVIVLLEDGSRRYFRGRQVAELLTKLPERPYERGTYDPKKDSAAKSEKKST